VQAIGQLPLHERLYADIMVRSKYDSNQLLEIYICIMGAVPLAILQNFRRKQLSFNILISIAFPLSLSTNRTSMTMTRFSQTDFSRDCEVTIPDRQDDSRKVISRWSDAGR
jgi:hypothetical protein